MDNPTQTQPTIACHASSSSSERSVSPTPYWDSLSKVVLSSCTLRELDRRHKKLKPSTKIWVTKPQDLSRFARRGGPNLSCLRGYSSAVRSRNRTQPPSSSIAELAANNENPKTVFDAAFEQHLNDLHIYPYSPWLDCTEGDRDINYVRQAIRAERLDVSMWHYDNHNSWENQANVQRCHVSAKIIHNFCGSTPKRSQLYSRFTVMEPMSKFHPDRRPMPTYFDGAPVQMLHDELKNDQKLRRLIVPSDDDEIPVAPNFFLEMAPDGYWDETVRRVAYFAAHGARAMHALQSYRDEDAQYDGMSYSAIYQADMQYLSLYIHYVTAPKTQDGRPTYHMHLIQEYLLREKDRFLEGVTALRNLGDLARRHRERFIEAANAKASTITHMIG